MSTPAGGSGANVEEMTNLVDVKLKLYDPPGRLPDFDHIPGQLQQWSNAVAGWIDEIVAYHEANTLAPGERCQFYNSLKYDPGPGLVQPIPWIALPNTLVRRFGRQQALEKADTLFPIGERVDGAGAYYAGPAWRDIVYRPQDEYCEWRVTRDFSGRITRIVFTSEPPEYWQALHGDTLPGSTGKPGRFPFHGDRKLLVDLYRRYVSTDVQLADLEAKEDMVDLRNPAKPELVIPKGAYNPWNRWNTTDGLMHLCHPSNTLSAEIVLGVDATILRKRGGRPVDDPDALVCCAGYGGSMRNSDPTIGSTVNNLARAGASITLRNPIGLYMSHLNLVGITRPDGRPIDSRYFRVERGVGDEHLIERAVFEIPDDDQPLTGDPWTVGDLRIAGEPIDHGGQVAERITVALFGFAAKLGSFHNTPVGCARYGCQSLENPRFLRLVDVGKPCPPGTRPAFDYPGEQDAAGNLAETATTATPTFRSRA